MNKLPKNLGLKRSAIQRLSATMNTISHNVESKRQKVSPGARNKVCKKLKLKENPALSFLKFKSEEINVPDTNSIEGVQPSTYKPRSITKNWVPPIVKKCNTSFENIKKWKNQSIEIEKTDFHPIEHLKIDLPSLKNIQHSTDKIVCDSLGHDNNEPVCSQFETNIETEIQEITFDNTVFQTCTEIATSQDVPNDHLRIEENMLSKDSEVDLTNNSFNLVNTETSSRNCNDFEESECDTTQCNIRDCIKNSDICLENQENVENALNTNLNNFEEHNNAQNISNEHESEHRHVSNTFNEEKDDIMEIDLMIDEEESYAKAEVVNDGICNYDIVNSSYKNESDTTNFYTSLEYKEQQECIDGNNYQEKTIVSSSTQLSTNSLTNCNIPLELPSDKSDVDLLTGLNDVDQHGVTRDMSKLNNVFEQPSQNKHDFQSMNIGILDKNCVDNVENENDDMENDVISASITDYTNKNEEINSCCNETLNASKEIIKQFERFSEFDSSVSMDNNHGSNSVSKCNKTETNKDYIVSNNTGINSIAEVKFDKKLNNTANNDLSLIVDGKSDQAHTECRKQKIYEDLIECSDDFYNLPMSQFVRIENEYNESIPFTDKQEQENSNRVSDCENEEEIGATPAAAEANNMVKRPLPPVPRLDWLRRAQDEKQKLRNIVQDINSLNSIIEQCRKEIWPQFPK